ncbi:armadillo-type protein [Halteromyces radiatus]|uniref:armadillo-type protein n=1 Tax=Halteromyces radiatus TaxID=101107 RepID=UPI00221EAFD9|nr:armadillo-type protein [Halteromyces radiatus]KAI8099719.1 armadillo-type protein [Halteromyces radiatus]
MSDSSAYMVANLLEKMDSEDRDFRYMALNDLMNELQKNSFNNDSLVEAKVVAAVLKLMGDKNTEVQNLAVKCLAPLVKQIREEHMLDIINKLCQFASQQKNEELRGIASIGLKTVVLEVNPNRGHRVSASIIPKLLQILQQAEGDYETQMDTLDILADVISRFGGQISAAQQSSIQQTLLPLLSHSRTTIRKRTTMAIGYLVVHVNDALFDTTLHYILEGLEKNQNSDDKLRTFVQASGILSRYSPTRLGKHLSEIVPIITKYAQEADEDDELREISLQTLESFVVRCPTEITVYIDQIITLGLEFLKYDPNFADHDEDDDMMDEDEEEEDEEDEYDDIAEYSDDDDDMSWKVRRAATKLLTSVIETRSDLLLQLYESVSPALISRFNEREESVRIDILNAFIALLRQTNLYSSDGHSSAMTNEFDLEFDMPSYDEGFILKAVDTVSTTNMDITEGPKQQLLAQVPKLCRTLSKQLSSKSTQTRQIGFHLLHVVITVLHGGLDNEISLFVPVIESSLSTSTLDLQQSAMSSNLKIEVLSFLRTFLRTHPANVTQPYLHQLCPAIINSISDRFYKITSEAFMVCIELIKSIRPIQRIPNTNEYNIAPVNQDYVGYIMEIYQLTLKVLGTNNADQEVKERSIMCLGALLAQAVDVLESEQRHAWNVLLERLQNEVTRLISVRTLAIVSQSPVAAGEELARCVLTAVDGIALLLRKSNRSLRVASLECLNILIKRFGTKISDQSYQQLLTEVRPLITDSDLHLLPLALQLVDSIITIRPTSVTDIKVLILPTLFQLIQSPLLQGASLKSLLNLFASLGRASPADYDVFIKGLVDPLLSAHTVGVSAGGVAAVANKQSASTVAQCVAVLAINNDQAHCESTVRTFLDYIKNASSNDSVRYLSLLILGEIGHKVDLSSHDSIHNDILNLFSAQSEEVKFAAAFAFGNLTVGNIGKYFPLIVSQIKEKPKRRFLLLHALKEVITRCDYQTPIIALEEASDDIWTLLLESSESDQEEGTRSVVGECLGKLALTNSSKYLLQLEARLASPSPQVRATVATAFKYIVVDPIQKNDDLLKPVVAQFLLLLEDSDINVRRLALLTVNSALHRKAYLVRDVLPSLLPLLYQETIVKEELIHTVEMGPFKHKVDDGLELRKAAYECLYTLLSTCLDRIDIHGYLDCVRIGLNDQHDIKMLVYLMLIRLSKVASTAVSQKLDDLVAPLKATLDFKIRSNAVKQELEKNQELVRATIRCIVALSVISETGTSPKFEQFVEEVRSGPLADEYKTTAFEVGKRESRSGDYMDLSS